MQFALLVPPQSENASYAPVMKPIFIKDTKVNDLMTLTMTFVLEIDNFRLFAAKGIRVSQTHPLIPLLLLCVFFFISLLRYFTDNISVCINVQAADLLARTLELDRPSTDTGPTFYTTIPLCLCSIRFELSTIIISYPLCHIDDHFVFVVTIIIVPFALWN